MNTKDLIQLNNEKREQLTKENKQYYGDMLVYIRTNFTKSERYIEEVLMELLDHLLQAQANGRTAKEVFGDDPKAYCNDIVGEIPSEKKANRLSFIFYLVMNLGGLVSLTAGTVGLGLFYIFGLGEGTIAFPLGSGILVVLIDLIFLLLFVMAILKWVKNSTFKEKQPRKWVEFLLLWVSTALFIGLSLLVPRLMPDIGYVIQISFPVFILTGAVMYISSVVMNKKMQLVK